jgi:hypothetical protein
MTFNKAFAMTEKPFAILTKSKKAEHLSNTNLETKNCRARNGDLRCTLDAQHRELNTAHAHRNEDGSLVMFHEVQK